MLHNKHRLHAFFSTPIAHVHRNKPRYWRMGVVGTLLILSNSINATTTTPTRPMGGWRYSAASTANFMQSVHYPASRQNDGGQDWSALISGKIAHRPKADVPAKLVVNGTVMPMAIDEGGTYARPYAFGSGSNSTEIRDGNSVVSRTQFYEANAGKSPVKLRIIMAWDTDHTDVDLHVVTPNGEHAWYGDRVIASGGAIDIDATDGYGPEIFATPNITHGAYQIYANYYGGENGDKAITTVKVTLVTYENTPKEKQQSVIVPLRKAGELTLVKQFIL